MTDYNLITPWHDMSTYSNQIALAFVCHHITCKDHIYLLLSMVTRRPLSRSLLNFHFLLNICIVFLSSSCLHFYKWKFILLFCSYFIIQSCYCSNLFFTFSLSLTSSSNFVSMLLTPCSKLLMKILNKTLIPLVPPCTPLLNHYFVVYHCPFFAVLFTH